VTTISYLRTILVAVALLAGSVITQAQQAKKNYRIGYLGSTSRENDLARAERYRQALRELGYIEGENVTIEYRYAAARSEVQSGLAEELVRLKVDLILVVGGDGVIRAAMNATKTIPIIIAGQGSDPVKAGFVRSLAHPGGNVTGYSILTTQLGGKRLELLKEAVAKLTRVALLYDPNAPGITGEVEHDIPVAARALKLTVQPWPVRDMSSLEKVFGTLSKQRPDGLYAPAAGLAMSASQKRIADFALKGRLPSMHSSSDIVSTGGLMSYAADEWERTRRVAYYVDRILKGAKPADLPVEQPTKFELAINLKTAKQIGLEIPQWTLMKADRVIR
jgi:putative tryptophan/tyrosine transport system substrate-binding protein